MKDPPAHLTCHRATALETRQRPTVVTNQGLGTRDPDKRGSRLTRHRVKGQPPIGEQTSNKIRGQSPTGSTAAPKLARPDLQKSKAYKGRPGHHPPQGDVKDRGWAFAPPVPPCSQGWGATPQHSMLDVPGVHPGTARGESSPLLHTGPGQDCKRPTLEQQ